MSDTSLDRKVGGVHFIADYRHFGGDRGPSLRVYATVAGRDVQLLRFDCFDKDPHYHYDPEGKDDHRKLDRASVPDPVKWTVDQLHNHLPEMVRTAGYAEVADRIDASAVTAAIPDIERAMRTVPANA